MGTMSDSQFEFEYNYDEDFYDDASADDDNPNDDHDSGMEEKLLVRNSYDTDTDIELTKPKTISSSHTPKKSNGKFGVRDQKTLSSSDPYKSYMAPTSRRAQSDPHSRKPKKPSGGNVNNKGASARLMVNNNSTTQNNVGMKRVLSASRKKATTLHNVIYELQQQCEALTIENRDLKRNVRVQDRDLRKLDGAEAQLPMLMKRHSNEVNVLQEKYKKQKEISTSLTENIKRVDIELLKTKDKLKEYQSIVKEKNLGERIELRNNILNLEKVIEEKECKISELNRNITLQKKTHSRITKEKNEKYEKAMQQVKVLEEVQNGFVSRIKDREKALEINNIYSRRKQKDGKQMVMFSPEDTIAPVPKKSHEESVQLTQKALFTENNEDEMCSVQGAGDRIDTMVSKNDNHITGQQDVSMHTEEMDATFLTEGELKMEESEDFYNINDGKEISITHNKDNIYPVRKEKSSTTIIDMDSLGDEELHEKLVQISEKGETNETVDLMINDKEQVHLRRVGVNEAYGKKGDSLQVQLERSVEKMEIVEKDHVRVNNELSEDAKARKLLLAKIQAIDNGENPNDITESSLSLSDKANEKKSKLNKKPIFLESSVIKSSSNMPDNNTDTKLLDALSSSNSKPDSGYSKPRRIHPVPDSHSGNHEGSSMKVSERKDSWEFKKTDENLHKDLPSHTSILLSPEITRNNGLPNNFNANKNRINASKHEDGYNMHSRYDTSYSPTVLDTNTGQNRKTSKKNGVNLFDQFEDPFRNEGGNLPVRNETGNLPVTKKDEPTELFSRKNTNSQTPDPVVIDDLEEMFIL